MLSVAAIISVSVAMASYASAAAVAVSPAHPLIHITPILRTPPGPISIKARAHLEYYG